MTGKSTRTWTNPFPTGTKFVLERFPDLWSQQESFISQNLQRRETAAGMDSNAFGYLVRLGRGGTAFVITVVYTQKKLANLNAFKRI